MSGHPDIVLRKYKTVVFINGCFWYGHNAEALEVGEHTNSDCCKIPNTNRSFRLDKINRNRERDVETTSALQAKVWRVITLWECDLKPKRRETTLNRLLDLLSPMKQCEICNATISIGAESDAIYVKQNNDYETNQ